MGNTRLYHKLLKKSAENQRQFVPQYHAAADQQDWELAMRLAHTLKSVAGNIGAELLESAARRLEQEAKEHQLDEDGLRRADDELSRVLKSIDGLDEPGTSQAQSSNFNADSPSPSFDEARLKSVLAELDKLIEDFDTAAQDILEKEEDIFSAAGLATESRLLANALAHYDFETAHATLEQIHMRLNA